MNSVRLNTVDESTREVIGTLALHKVQKFCLTSSFYDAEKEKQVQRISAEDLIVGKLLGKGCFNHVYAAHIVVKPNTVDAPEVETNLGPSYALKHLSPQALSDKKLFRVGAVDLAIEAQFLSCLQHENIVQLHAVTAGDISTAFSSTINGGYFLVMDRLEMTLNKQIEMWRSEEESPKRRLSFLKSAPFSCQPTLPHRLIAAHSIGLALQYLHERNIMYRDLKPDNIGFDINHTLKIFDFGLAKEISDTCPNEYCHTKMTGSLRYMAPEVAQGLPYGLSADIYSFAVLQWHIFSLEEPYSKYESFDSFMDEVIKRSERPKIKKAHCSHVLQRLIYQSWSPLANNRPSIEVLVTVIGSYSIK